MLASASGKVDCVKLLLDRGALADKADKGKLDDTMFFSDPGMQMLLRHSSSLHRKVTSSVSSCCSTRAHRSTRPTTVREDILLVLCDHGM